MSEGLGTFEQVVLLSILRLGRTAYGRAILNDAKNRLQRKSRPARSTRRSIVWRQKGLASSKLAPARHSAAAGRGATTR